MKRQDAAQLVDFETRIVAPKYEQQRRARTHTVGYHVQQQRPIGTSGTTGGAVAHDLALRKMPVVLCPFAKVKNLAPADPDTSWQRPTCKRCAALDPRWNQKPDNTPKEGDSSEGVLP